MKMQEGADQALKKPLPELSNWMERLDNYTRLNEIVMPGSHDAGMSQVVNCGSGAQFNYGIIQTQALNILEQLQAGSRYFDIRIDYDHRQLITYHRSGNAGGNGQSLMAVLDQALQFVQSHPSETFILKFSHIRTNRDNEREIKDRIDQFLADMKYRPYFFTRATSNINLAETMLGDCRGKIIMVFDYPEYISARSGRFRYREGLERSTSGELTASYRGHHISVCDAYTNTTSLEKMKHDQLTKLDTYGGLGKDYFFLLSWTLTPNADTFFNGSVKNLAGEANPALKEVLQKRLILPGHPLPNIVYIDYLDAETARCIIQCNF